MRSNLSLVKLQAYSWAAVSVLAGPGCSALLKLYRCKCAYCCIIGQINDDDDDDDDDSSKRCHVADLTHLSLVHIARTELKGLNRPKLVDPVFPKALKYM